MSAGTSIQVDQPRPTGSARNAESGPTRNNAPTSTDIRSADTDEVVPTLVVVMAAARAEVGAQLVLDRDRVVLGRGTGCDLTFDDPGVSRRHATVERLFEGSWLATDLDSTNGMFVNGRRVGHARLAEGDELRLGPSTVVRLACHRGPPRSALEQTRASVQPALWWWDAAHAAVTVSPGFERLVGAAQGSLATGPLPLNTLFRLEDCRRLESALDRLTHGEAMALELVTAQGDRRLELRAEAPAGASSRLPAAVVSGTAWDVTARHKASLELRHHAALFESFLDPVALLDNEGRVLDCNSATLRLFGVPKEALVGRTLDDASDEEWTQRALDRVRRLGRYEADRRQPRASGPEVVCEVVVTPLLDAGGTPLGFVAVHRDVTETRQLQARLALADRLSAMGTLAAGIAHEINNPLAYLRANLQHIHAQASPTAHSTVDADELLEAVRDCAEGVDRIASIVRDLKFFSRAEDAQLGAVDVQAAVRLASKMAQPMLRQGCELTLDTPELPLVRADHSRLTQVLLNLLINAAQAMPAGRAGQNAITVRAEPSGNGVLIEVADNGEGMTPEVLRRAFDPFFTTKPQGVGTGLGLSICHGIVEGFGGTISARSTPNVGTTFRIWLPASEEQAPRRGEHKARLSAGRALKVLVVDDEPQVLKALARILGDSHHVTQAHGAAEALPLLRGGCGYDLVLCDVLMPSTNGLELHQRLLAEDPALADPFVFMTGGGLSPQLAERLERSGVPVLDKPLDHARLFALLEARAATPPRAPRPEDDTLPRYRVAS